MTPRRSAVLCLLLCTSLAACGGDSGGGDAPQRGTIDSARKSGRDARAAVDGRVRDPAEILLRVSAAPKQRVTVSWGMSCPKSASGKAKGTGRVYVTTPPDTRALDAAQARDRVLRGDRAGPPVGQGPREARADRPRARLGRAGRRLALRAHDDVDELARHDDLLDDVVAVEVRLHLRRRAGERERAPRVDAPVGAGTRSRTLPLTWQTSSNVVGLEAAPGRPPATAAPRRARRSAGGRRRPRRAARTATAATRRCSSAKRTAPGRGVAALGRRRPRCRAP